MSPALTTLIETIGEEKTFLLLQYRAGVRLFVPKEPKEGYELTNMIGLEAALALSKVYGGESIAVPIAREWRVARLSAEGKKVPAIARAVGMTEDGVRKIRRNLEIQQAQYSLFD